MKSKQFVHTDISASSYENVKLETVNFEYEGINGPKCTITDQHYAIPSQGTNDPLQSSIKYDNAIIITSKSDPCSPCMWITQFTPLVVVLH